MLKLKVIIDSKKLAYEVDDLLMEWLKTEDSLENLTQLQIGTIRSMVDQAIRIKVDGEGVQDYVRS